MRANWVGVWPSIDFGGSQREKSGLNDEYEEYAIRRLRVTLRLTNTISITTSIDYGEMVMELPDEAAK